MSQESSQVIEPTIRACQLAAGHALDWWEPPCAEMLLEPFLHVPDPSTFGDALIVHSILSQFVDALAIHLHRSFHRQYQPSARSCTFTSRGVDAAEPASIGTSAIKLLDHWLARYRHEFDLAHRTLAQRARRYFERHAAETVTIADVAAALNTDKRSLQRAFLGETGLHLKEYQMRLRLARALPLLWSGEKIEAVALLVGWKSKKDLYRATDRFVGRSPSGIRSMSSEGLERAIRDLHSVARLRATA